MALKYSRTRPYPQRKIRKIEELKKILREYKHMVLINIRDVNANQMKQLRQNVWGKGLVKVFKNNLLKVAISQLSKDRPELQKLLDYLSDMHALLLTNDDAFELARIANSIREKRALKPGKVSPIDVVIHKGFTGLKPGPEMSEMRMAGVPVRIFDGEVFVSQDHILVKAGQVVSPYAARVMELLDIKPLSVGPEVVVGLVDGMIIPKEVLLKTIEDYIKEFQLATREVQGLVLEAGIIVPEFLEDLLTLVSRQAFNVIRHTGIISTESLDIAVQTALSEVISLVDSIKEDLPSIPEEIAGILSAATPSKQAEEKPSEEEAEKPKEEKKSSEEEALSGLSLLF